MSEAREQQMTPFKQMHNPGDKSLRNSATTGALLIIGVMIWLEVFGWHAQRPPSRQQWTAPGTGPKETTTVSQSSNWTSEPQKPLHLDSKEWCTRLFLQRPRVYTSLSEQQQLSKQDQILCKRLQSTCLSNPRWMRQNHALLAASLWHQCLGETVLTAKKHHMKAIVSASKETSGRDPIKLNCSAHGGQILAPVLDLPAKVDLVWVEACDICTLLRADWSDLKRKFVLFSFRTLNPGIDRGGGVNGIGAFANFGALGGGYDHMCDNNQPNAASATGCALVLALAARCPERTLSDVITFLDNPWLRMFVTSQDVFTFRRTPDSDLLPHEKVFSFPLGVHFRDAKAWSRPGMFKLGMNRLFADSLNSASRRQLVVARNGIAFQRVALSLQAKTALKDDINISYNRQSSRDVYATDVMGSKYVFSPPGWGSDCYRHYEAVLLGAVPLVLRSTFLLTGALRWLPTVDVDDYGSLQSSNLETMWQNLALTAAPEVLFAGVAPAFVEYWGSALARAALQGRQSIGTKLGQWWISRMEVSGERCHENSYESVAVALEAQSSQAAKFSSNPLKEVGEHREFCECPCQCGLCDPTLFSVKVRNNSRYFDRPTLDAARSTQYKRGFQTDFYHATRCFVKSSSHQRCGRR